MLVGYARVSTQDQNLDLQKDALQQAGCERIFEDQVSGARSDQEIAQIMGISRATLYNYLRKA